MKVCSKCGVEKAEDAFQKGRNQCKVCRKEYKKECSKEYYQQNADKYKAYSKEYYQQNVDKIKEYRKEYYRQNADKYKEYQKSDKYKEYQKSDKYKKYKKEYSKEYQKSDKRKEYQKSDKRKECMKEYEKADKRKEYKKEYIKERLQTDQLFAFSRRIRSLIRMSLRKKGYSKRSHTYELLGADFETVMAHLGPKPEGDYHIDHICPCAQGRNEEERCKLMHYTNLRWMPASENLSKSDNWTPEGAELCQKLLEREWIHDRGVQRNEVPC